MELLQATQGQTAVETLNVGKLLGGSVDLNVRGAARMPARDTVVGLAASVAVVLDANRRSVRTLIDDEGENGLMNGQVLAIESPCYTYTRRVIPSGSSSCGLSCGERVDNGLHLWTGFGHFRGLLNGRSLGRAEG